MLLYNFTLCEGSFQALGRVLDSRLEHGISLNWVDRAGPRPGKSRATLCESAG